MKRDKVRVKTAQKPPQQMQLVIKPVSDQDRVLAGAYRKQAERTNGWEGLKTGI